MMSFQLIYSVIALIVLSVTVTRQQEQDCTVTRADVVFLVDESSSIQPQAWKQQKEFVKQMIRNFDIGPDYTRISLVTFSTGASLVFSLKRYTEEDRMLKAVDNLRQQGGDTDTAEALMIAREYVFLKRMGSRRHDQDIPQICIVITDGNSRDAAETKRQSDLMKGEGINVFAIGVGEKVSQSELANIGSGDEFIFSVDDYDKLENIELMLNHKACEVTKPPPTTTTIATTTTTPMPTTTTTATPTFPPLYVTPDCQKKKADVVILLDTSSGIRAPDFAEMTTFVQALAFTFDIQPNITRFGLMSFADKPTIHFDFNEHATREDIYEAAAKIKKQRGERNLDVALKVIRSRLFEPRFGGRTKVAKVVILVTDGPTSNLESVLKERDALRRQHGVELFAVGVGTHGVPENELQSLVGQERFLRVYEYRQLRNLRYIIADRTCRVEPPPQDFGCGDKRGADLVFIMDTLNAGSNGIISIRSFLRNIIRKFEIGPKRIQISSVPSECGSVQGFDLDTYTTREDVLAAFKVKKQYNLEKLLNEVAANTFLPSHGGRPREEANRVAILITDEKPNNMAAVKAKSAALMAKGVTIYVIGVGDLVQEEALGMIASKPLERHLFMVDSYEMLERNKDEIVGGLTSYICQGL